MSEKNRRKKNGAEAPEVLSSLSGEEVRIEQPKEEQNAEEMRKTAAAVLLRAAVKLIEEKSIASLAEDLAEAAESGAGRPTVYSRVSLFFAEILFYIELFCETASASLTGLVSRLKEAVSQKRSSRAQGDNAEETERKKEAAQFASDVFQSQAGFSSIAGAEDPKIDGLIANTVQEEPWVKALIQEMVSEGTGPEPDQKKEPIPQPSAPAVSGEHGEPGSPAEKDRDALVTDSIHEALSASAVKEAVLSAAAVTETKENETEHLTFDRESGMAEAFLSEDELQKREMLAREREAQRIERESMLEERKRMENSVRMAMALKEKVRAREKEEQQREHQSMLAERRITQLSADFARTQWEKVRAREREEQRLEREAMLAERRLLIDSSEKSAALKEAYWQKELEARRMEREAMLAERRLLIDSSEKSAALKEAYWQKELEMRRMEREAMFAERRRRDASAARSEELKEKFREKARREMQAEREAMLAERRWNEHSAVIAQQLKQKLRREEVARMEAERMSLLKERLALAQSVQFFRQLQADQLAKQKEKILLEQEQFLAEQARLRAVKEAEERKREEQAAFLSALRENHAQPEPSLNETDRKTDLEFPEEKGVDQEIIPLEYDPVREEHPLDAVRLQEDLRLEEALLDEAVRQKTAQLEIREIKAAEPDMHAEEIGSFEKIEPADGNLLEPFVREENLYLDETLLQQTATMELSKINEAQENYSAERSASDPEVIETADKQEETGRKESVLGLPLLEKELQSHDRTTVIFDHSGDEEKTFEEESPALKTEYEAEPVKPAVVFISADAGREEPASAGEEKAETPAEEAEPAVLFELRKGTQEVPVVIATEAGEEAPSVSLLQKSGREKSADDAEIAGAETEPAGESSLHLTADLPIDETVSESEKPEAEPGTVQEEPAVLFELREGMQKKQEEEIPSVSEPEEAPAVSLAKEEDLRQIRFDALPEEEEAESLRESALHLTADPPIDEAVSESENTEPEPAGAAEAPAVLFQLRKGVQNPSEEEPAVIEPKTEEEPVRESALQITADTPIVETVSESEKPEPEPGTVQEEPAVLFELRDGAQNMHAPESAGNAEVNSESEEISSEITESAVSEEAAISIRPSPKEETPEAMGEGYPLGARRLEEDSALEEALRRQAVLQKTERLVLSEIEAAAKRERDVPEPEGSEALKALLSDLVEAPEDYEFFFPQSDSSQHAQQLSFDELFGSGDFVSNTSKLSVDELSSALDALPKSGEQREPENSASVMEEKPAVSFPQSDSFRQLNFEDLSFRRTEDQPETKKTVPLMEKEPSPSEQGSRTLALAEHVYTPVLRSSPIFTPDKSMLYDPLADVREESKKSADKEEEKKRKKSKEKTEEKTKEKPKDKAEEISGEPAVTEAAEKAPSAAGKLFLADVRDEALSDSLIRLWVKYVLVWMTVSSLFCISAINHSRTAITVSFFSILKTFGILIFVPGACVSLLLLLIGWLGEKDSEEESEITLIGKWSRYSYVTLIGYLLASSLMLADKNKAVSVLSGMVALAVVAIIWIIKLYCKGRKGTKLLPALAAVCLILSFAASYWIVRGDFSMIWKLLP